MDRAIRNTGIRLAMAGMLIVGSAAPVDRASAQVMGQPLPQDMMMPRTNGKAIPALCPLEVDRVEPDVARNLPPPGRFAGTQCFREGGIGSDESAAMKQVMKLYPLGLLFALSDGTQDAKQNVYTTNVAVSVRTPDGKSLLELPSAGPYVAVDLPAGRYRVMASHKGRAQTREVTIKTGKHQRVGFSWPMMASAPASAPVRPAAAAPLVPAPAELAPTPATTPASTASPTPTTAPTSPAGTPTSP